MINPLAILLLKNRKWTKNLRTDSVLCTYLEKIGCSSWLTLKKTGNHNFFTQVDLCTDKETDESTKKVKAVSTSEHLFTFGKSKERKSRKGFVSPGWKNLERILKNQGLYILLKLVSKDFSQILHTYLYIVPEFSVLNFGKSNKCSNGLTVFKSYVETASVPAYKVLN